MNVTETILSRRSLRSYQEGTQISDETISALLEAASLAPSCFNNQPWRFIFVREKRQLTALQDCLSPGNDWAKNAPLLIAVVSRQQDDCIIKERLYYQFDTGMATAFLMLKAQEQGLISHAMAGFSPQKTRGVLSIPADYDVITLIAVGKKADSINPSLSPEQQQSEKERPARKAFSEIGFLEKFSVGAFIS